jgi:hypothetical protein
LFSSTLPADVLYDENSLPRVDDELAPASTSTSGKQRQQGQVGDNFRQARTLALVIKRPMAISPPAIDERAASLHRKRNETRNARRGRRSWIA